MNALIDLNKCREYVTVTIGGKDHQIKLSGTIEDPYFCGRDVCSVLGYKNFKKALEIHVKSKFKTTLAQNRARKLGPKLGPNFLGSNEPLTYHTGKAIYINEPGLYALIMHSNAMFAEEFQDMVYETILPSIRKYGSYQVETQLVQVMERLSIKEKSEEELQVQLSIKEKSEEQLQVQLDLEKESRIKAEKEAEEHRQYALVLKELTINDQKRPLNEIIYISTSKAYANQNRFKVGGVETTDKLRSRFSNYNSRSSVDDEWYYSDLFKVASFKACEKRIEDILGRFREKKSKEIYVLHYSNLRQHIEWICEHYEDEVEKFNEELVQLTNNLNRHHLRPVVPTPYRGTHATITRIVDGRPMCTTIESTVEDKFKDKIKVYLDTLEPTTTEIRRTELFDQVPFNFNKIEAWRWLKEIIASYKPEVNLKYR